MEGDIERVGDRYRVRRLIGETWMPSRARIVPRRIAAGRLCVPAGAGQSRRCGRTGCAWPAGAGSTACTTKPWSRFGRPSSFDRTTRSLSPPQTLAAIGTGDRPDKAGRRDGKETRNGADGGGRTDHRLAGTVRHAGPTDLMDTCSSLSRDGTRRQIPADPGLRGRTRQSRTLERNLAAVLAEINLSQPESSRLLTKAVSDHVHRTGTDQGPQGYAVSHPGKLGQADRGQQSAPARFAAVGDRSLRRGPRHLRRCRKRGPPQPRRRPDGARMHAPTPRRVQHRHLFLRRRPFRYSNPVAAPPPPPPPVGPADQYDPNCSIGKRIRDEQSNPGK